MTKKKKESWPKPSGFELEVGKEDNRSKSESNLGRPSSLELNNNDFEDDERID
ncbi:MAG: hypothetical protein ACFFAS_03830 [Promethearchaeota archaeon]